LTWCLQDEKLKDTIRRLRHQVKIAWDKTRLEKGIKTLRISNDNLRRLLKQSKELDSVASARNKISPMKVVRKCTEIQTIRDATVGLHEAFASAWSHPASSHPGEEVRHTVKLFLDAKYKDDVRMDVAIMCHGHGFFAR